MSTRSKRASGSAAKYFEEDSEEEEVGSEQDEDDSEMESTATTTAKASTSTAVRHQRQAKSKAKAKAVDPVFEEEDDYDSEVERATKKKATSQAKGKAKAPRGNASKLQYFKEMPLDIFYEICSHLDPITLLFFARTSKSMRASLMTKNSASLWMAARRNVYLPDLDAEDISEPEYASLIYEKWCRVCEKSRSQIVSYSLRVRYCKGCQRKTLLYEKALLKVTGPLHDETLNCSRTTSVGLTGRRSGRAYYFLHDVQALNRKLISLEAEHDALPKSQKQDSRYLKFLEEKKAALKFAFTDERRILNWEQQSKSNRAEEHAKASQSRSEAVKVKLIALGHDPRDVASVLWTSAASQPTALTESIWNKISTKLIADTEEAKRHRLDNEARRRNLARQQLVKPFYEQLRLSQPTSSQQKLFPFEYDFLHFTSITPFYDAEDSTIDQNSWNLALPTIQIEVDERIQSNRLSAATRLVTYTSPVKLPTRVLEFDGITKIELNEEEVDFILSKITSGTWCCEHFRNFEDATNHCRDQHPYQSYVKPEDWIVKSLRKFLVAAGLEEDNAKVEDLKELGKRFECVGCDPTGGVFVGLWGRPRGPPEKINRLGFEEAMTHIVSHHRSYWGRNSEANLRLMSVEEIEELEAVEAIAASAEAEAEAGTSGNAQASTSA